LPKDGRTRSALDTWAVIVVAGGISEGCQEGSFCDHDEMISTFIARSEHAHKAVLARYEERHSKGLKEAMAKESEANLREFLESLKGPKQ